MSGYYKQSASAKDALHALFTLNHDIEFTVFGEDGRDVTFKGFAGDSIVLAQDSWGDWGVVATIRPEDLDDEFVQLGES